MTALPSIPLAADPQSSPRRLVALLRGWTPEGHPAACRALLQAEDDWPGVLAAARAGRVLQLLAMLAESSGATLAAAAAAALGDVRRAARRAGLPVAHATSGVLATLEAGGVTAAAFKGQLVAAQAYGDPLARTSTDLDLLVDRRDLPKAVAILAADGYLAEPPLPRRTAAVVLRGECELLLRRPKGLSIELHWSVIPPSYGTPLPADRLLRRSEPVDVLGWPLRSLTFEDAAVVAAVHGYKHFWQLLEHAVCLGRLLTSPELDPDALLVRARELRALRRTLVGAGVAATVMDEPLPQSVVAALEADPEAVQIASLAAQELWGTLDGDVQMRMIGRSTRLDVRALDRPADLARCLAAKLALPRLEDREWVSLPDEAAPLYYGVRPARLVANAVGALRGKMTRGPADPAGRRVD